ncbi:TPA: hypothetical protein N0F65_007809 [Lagenidium giganteum]|uniref:Uncharacterized protein n=1 Tax=Lagenidium giganteum TaxID=4803 RepID=A0AAV2Z3N6_9STRA|nr:TPA: hypothetical protein N0F65_007809 [Lagenidium giganteum]
MAIRQVNKQLHEVVLAQTYLDNNHVELFTPADWELVHQMDDEMDPLGHFECVHLCATPEENAVYAPFLTCQHYTNELCAKWGYSKNRLPPVAFR